MGRPGHVPVVVVLALVSNGKDRHIRRRPDLDQGDLVRPGERDDPFAQQRTLPGLEAGERRMLEGRESVSNRRVRLLGQLRMRFPTNRGCDCARFAGLGAVATYTETSESVPVPKNTGVAGFSKAGITYTALRPGPGNVFVSAPGFTNFGAGVPQPTTSSVLVANGDEHFDVRFATPADVVAMDVYLNGLGPLMITFFNGSTELGTATWDSGDDVRFVGFMDALPVTRFEFISTLGGRLNTGIDNVAVASVPDCTDCRVPEPATAGLAVLGLFAAAFAARAQARQG